MLEKIINNEMDYIKNFSTAHELDNYIRFEDTHITDMYSHNFLFLKGKLGEQEIRDIVKEEMELRRQKGFDFLYVESQFDIDTSIFQTMGLKVDKDHCDYMSISPSKFDRLSGNFQAVVKEAVTQEVLQDGRRIDITVNSEEDGRDFAVRRCERKGQIYGSNKNIRFYVCYDGEIPVGMCEMFLNGSIAKIEEFDVLPQHQRKGYGTTIIKHLLGIAHREGVETAYVVTDSDDSAREMYGKVGFKTQGQKTLLYFPV